MMRRKRLTARCYGGIKRLYPRVRNEIELRTVIDQVPGPTTRQYPTDYATSGQAGVNERLTDARASWRVCERASRPAGGRTGRRAGERAGPGKAGGQAVSRAVGRDGSKTDEGIEVGENERATGKVGGKAALGGRTGKRRCTDGRQTGSRSRMSASGGTYCRIIIPSPITPSLLDEFTDLLTVNDGRTEGRRDRRTD